MKVIELDKDTHDLKFTNRKLVLIDGKERLYQQLKCRLETIYGEWFLDTQFGVKYYEEIWVKNPNLAVVNGILKAIILETPDVLEITSFSSALNTAKRTLTIAFTVKSSFGIVAFTGSL